MSKPDETGQRTDPPYYENATGGWGSLKGVSRILADQRPTLGTLRTPTRQNKPAFRGRATFFSLIPRRWGGGGSRKGRW